MMKRSKKQKGFSFREMASRLQPGLLERLPRAKNESETLFDRVADQTNSRLAAASAKRRRVVPVVALFLAASVSNSTAKTPDLSSIGVYNRREIVKNSDNGQSKAVSNENRNIVRHDLGQITGGDSRK